MKHILKMSCGITCEMELNEETAEMTCEWDPDPPYSKSLIKKIKAEYEPWRNDILQQWAKRTGKKVMVITI